MTVWIKQGVMGDLSPQMSKGLKKIADVFAKEYAQHLYVTSMREGNHQPGSFHYRGDAVDIKAMDCEKKHLQNTLGSDFDVVQFTASGSVYFHVEYDPK